MRLTSSAMQDAAPGKECKHCKSSSICPHQASRIFCSWFLCWEGHEFKTLQGERSSLDCSKVFIFPDPTQSVRKNTAVRGIDSNTDASMTHDADVPVDSDDHLPEDEFRRWWLLCITRKQIGYLHGRPDSLIILDHLAALADFQADDVHTLMACSRSLLSHTSLTGCC